MLTPWTPKTENRKELAVCFSVPGNESFHWHISSVGGLCSGRVVLKGVTVELVALGSC